MLKQNFDAVKPGPNLGPYIESPEEADLLAYKRTHVTRLLDCAPDFDTFCAWHDEHLELVDGDPHAPLHPSLVARCDARRKIPEDREHEPWPAERLELWNAAVESAMDEMAERAQRAYDAWCDQRAAELERRERALANPYRDALILCKDFQHIRIPVKKYHLYPFIWSGSYGMISGERGGGKTFFALGMADKVTRGDSFGPWKCNEPASVMYVEAEMSLQDDTERINTMDLSCDRAKPFYMVSNAYVQEIMHKPVISLTDESTRRHLMELILDNDIDVVFFDNIASLTPGIDENSKYSTSKVN